MRICWSCLEPEPTPGPGPEPDNCIGAEELFDSPVSNLSEVDLGTFVIRQAFLPDGSPVPLNVTDCMGVGEMGVEVPWSEENASQYAVIEFKEELCGEYGPQVVDIRLAHGTRH